MKKVWKRTLFFVLAAVSALCFAAGCAKTEPGKVESVTITYNGSAVGDSLTVNLARGAVGLGVNVEISGEGVSQEATLESSNETVATISESGYNVILVTAGETVITATSVADFELNFNSGDYNPVLSEDGSKVTFTYTGIDSHSYNNVSTPIDYPASAECNRFSFTVWNLGTRDVDFMLVLSRDGEEISKEFRLNGENGFQATVPAGGFITVVCSYTPGEVKSIGIFIDSIDGGEPTTRSGSLTFGNFAFFTEEPAPVWAAESGDAARYTVTDDAATGGWHVTYTGTNWNMYAGVKINLTNRGEIAEANKLVFKIKNNSSTHVPEYAVTVKGENGTLKENVKGTVSVNGETTVTVEWDGGVPTYVQIFLDDAWKENPTSDPSAEGDVVIYDFQLTAE